MDRLGHVRRFARTLWRLIVYAGLLVGLVLLLARGATAGLKAAHVHFDHPPGTAPVEELLLIELIILVAALISTFVMTRIERRALADYGLPLDAPRVAGGFAAGALWGLAIMAALVGSLWLANAYAFGGLAAPGSTLARSALLWILIAAINGFGENLAVLGYPLAALRGLIGFWPAALLLSLLFTLAHLGNGGENAIGLASIFLQGLLLCTAVHLTGNLWLSMGLHAGGVFAEDFLFSLPDSGVVYTGHLSNASLTGPDWLTGGAVGPEASVMAAGVFLAALVGLMLVHRRRSSSPVLS